MSIRTKLLTCFAVIALATASSATFASAAFADQTNSGGGCSITSYTPTETGSAQIQFGAVANCNASDSRVLKATLWHDYDFFPDVAVSTAQDSETNYDYSAGSTTCDGGGDTTYYTYGDLQQNGNPIVDAPYSGNVVITGHC